MFKESLFDALNVANKPGLVIRNKVESPYWATVQINADGDPVATLEPEM